MPPVSHYRPDRITVRIAVPSVSHYPPDRLTLRIALPALPSVSHVLLLRGLLLGSTVAVVYRDSIVSDVNRVKASTVDLTPEALSAVRALLEQTRSKLGLLEEEIAKNRDGGVTAQTDVHALVATIQECKAQWIAAAAAATAASGGE